jgi:hypothetical protein
VVNRDHRETSGAASAMTCGIASSMAIPVSWVFIGNILRCWISSSLVRQEALISIWIISYLLNRINIFPLTGIRPREVIHCPRFRGNRDSSLMPVDRILSGNSRCDVSENRKAKLEIQRQKPERTYDTPFEGHAQVVYVRRGSGGSCSAEPEEIV